MKLIPKKKIRKNRFSASFSCVECFSLDVCWSKSFPRSIVHTRRHAYRRPERFYGRIRFRSWRYRLDTIDRCVRAPTDHLRHPRMEKYEIIGQKGGKSYLENNVNPAVPSWIWRLELHGNSSSSIETGLNSDDIHSYAYWSISTAKLTEITAVVRVSSGICLVLEVKAHPHQVICRINT